MVATPPSTDSSNLCPSCHTTSEVRLLELGVPDEARTEQESWVVPVAYYLTSTLLFFFFFLLVTCPAPIILRPALVQRSLIADSLPFVVTALGEWSGGLEGRGFKEV